MAEEVMESRRFERRQERMDKLRATAPKRVRVDPRDDEMRKLLTHPAVAGGFPASGSVEWPLDQFTKKRLSEGVIILAQDQQTEPEQQQQSEPEQQQQARAEPEQKTEAKAARKPSS